MVIQITKMYFGLYMLGLHPPYLKVLQSHRVKRCLINKGDLGPHLSVGANCQEDQSCD